MTKSEHLNKVNTIREILPSYDYNLNNLTVMMIGLLEEISGKLNSLKELEERLIKIEENTTCSNVKTLEQPVVKTTTKK